MLRYLVSLLVVFLFMVSPVQSTAEEVWKITSLDWEPYSSSQMATQGNSIQKLRETLRAHGIRLVVEFYPWLRAQNVALKEGYIGYFPPWPEEVADGFVASEAVDYSELAVITRTDNVLSYKTLDDLYRNYKVGTVFTYKYPSAIEEAIRRFPKNSDPAPSDVSLMLKLSHGRNDAIISDPGVIAFLANSSGISNIKTDRVLMSHGLVFAFKKGEEGKRDVLNELLKKPEIVK